MAINLATKLEEWSKLFIRNASLTPRKQAATSADVPGIHLDGVPRALAVVFANMLFYFF